MEHTRPLAKVIAVINHKGGVGKTHTVWLLSAVCEERSLRMLIVNADTQANITKSFLPERDERPDIEALFNSASDERAQGIQEAAEATRDAQQHFGLVVV